MAAYIQARSAHVQPGTQADNRVGPEERQATAGRMEVNEEALAATAAQLRQLGALLAQARPGVPPLQDHHHVVLDELASITAGRVRA